MKTMYHSQQQSTSCNKAEVIPSIFGQLVEPNLTTGHVLDRFFRRRYIALLETLNDGYIVVRDALGETHIGDENAKQRCVLTMHSMQSYTKVALGGSNGAAQAYIDGHWSVDDLSTLIRIFVSNRVILDKMESGFTRILQKSLKVWHSANKNTSRFGTKHCRAL